MRISRVEIHSVTRRGTMFKEKITGAKNTFFVLRKNNNNNKNQIGLGSNIWYQFKTFCTGSKNLVLIQKQIVPKVKLNLNISSFKKF